MCVIVVKPEGQIIEDKILKQCFKNNPDGAGIMFPENGKVKIQKGFMVYQDFLKFWKTFQKENDVKKIPIVFHFRIATQGKVNGKNCHPFPLTENEEDLKKESILTNIGITHNGIIPFCTDYSNYSVLIDSLSDTQIFIKDYLYSIYKDFPSFYKNKAMRDLIQESTNSKFAIMANNTVYTIGNFNSYKGNYFSNESYKPYKPKIVVPTNYTYVYPIQKDSIYSLVNEFKKESTYNSLCPECGETWTNCWCGEIASKMFDFFNDLEIEKIIRIYPVNKELKEMLEGGK